MTYVELAPPKRQRAWGWPAVVSLTMGGAGAGLYLIGTGFSIFNQPWLLESRRIPFQILAPAIVCLGFFTVAIEAGKPWRAYRLFSKLTTSWMAVESLAGAVFINVAVISWFFPWFVFNAIAVISAFILLISQGFMVFRAAGVQSWDEKVVPIVFVTSGLMTACGFFLLSTKSYFISAKLPIAVFIILIVTDLLFWLNYVFKQRDNGSTQKKFLRRPLLLLIIAGIGHIFPFAYLFWIFFNGDIENTAVSSTVLGSITGLVLIGCGAAQKAGIILGAGFFRSFALKEAQNY